MLRLIIATLFCLSVSGVSSQASDDVQSVPIETVQVEPIVDRVEVVDPSGSDTSANIDAEQQVPLVEQPLEVPVEAGPVPIIQRPSDDVPTIQDQPLLTQALELDRLEASRLFEDLSDAEEFEQALSAAEIAYQKTIDEFSPQHEEAIPVLTDLGQALLNVGRPTEARVRFRQSVELIEQYEGIFSDSLVRPLMGIGLSHQVLFEDVAAVRSFQRAQHVTHRNTGVVNIDQVPIIKATAKSLVRANMLQEAEKLVQLIEKIYRRNYGENSPEVVPGLIELANYYRDTGDFRRARIAINEGLEILDQHYPPDHEAYLPPLQALSDAFVQQSAPYHFDKGLQVHQRIVDIFEANRDLPSEQRVDAHLRLGDWYIKFNDEQKAWQQYRYAWEYAQNAGEQGDYDWAESFERVHVIHDGPELAPDILAAGRSRSEYFYRFELDVTAEGRPRSVKVLDTNLSAQSRAPAIRAILFARFRPRIVDGVAVATKNHKIKRVYQLPLDTAVPGSQTFIDRRGYPRQGLRTSNIR